jgi:hypothetical protein
LDSAIGEARVTRKSPKIIPPVKVLLGFSPSASDARVRKEWNRRAKNVCKPCWELKYCPYGPLVEQFPCPPIPRPAMIDNNEMLKGQLREGIKNAKRRRSVQHIVGTFDPRDYPEKVDHTDDEKARSVFGHYCPVFFVNEPLTETQELRRIGRHIPRQIMLRVVRRDKKQCQSCGKVLRDG